MAGDDLIEGAIQRIAVKRPVQVQRSENMISRAFRIELMEEPHPFLGMRHCQRVSRGFGLEITTGNIVIHFPREFGE